MLQKINLTHLRNFNTFIDITNPRKLREFRALDTQLRYALFADGAPLSIVHLPSSITRLKFIENKNLTRILTSTPIVADMVNGELVYRNEASYAGLYVQGLTDYVTGTAIKASELGEIEFEGDALGYGSYIILKNAVEIKEDVGGRLKIRMDNINWTPYVPVEFGESKQQDVNYFYLTDHSTYVPYDRVGSWQSDTLNGKVFTFDSSLPKSTISDLSLLDKFIADYENGVDTGTINQFTNNNESMTTRATVPTITGNLFVANAEGTAIAEDQLTNKYGVYWPNLIIRAENVSESYIGKYVQILDSGKESEIDIIRFSPLDYEGQRPTRTVKVPTKTNYVFKGWSLDAEGTKMVWDYDLLSQAFVEGSYYDNAEFKFSQQNNVIILYAIFEIQKYGIKFYDGDGRTLLVEDPNNPVYIITGLNQQEQVTVLVPYGGHVPTPKILPYKEDSSLARDEVYILKGWSATPDGDLANTTNKKVISNLSYYPIFEVGDVHNNVLSEDFFDVTTSNYTVTVPGYYNTGDPGVLIQLKSGYSVRGKITLPKAINGVKVRSVASGRNGANGFAGTDGNPNTKITAVFWEEGAMPEVYSQYAFAYCSNLIYAEFPASLYNIETQAFYRCSLHNRNLASAINLKQISSSAFNTAFGVTSEKEFTIPGSVELIQALAFAYNNTRYEETTAINSWQIGGDGDPTQLSSLPANINNGTNPFAYVGAPYLQFTIWTPTTMDPTVRERLELCASGSSIEWPLGE